MGDLSNRVDFLIKKNNLTRKGLCREIGIKDSTVRSWSNGATPSVDNAYKIAKYFNVSLEWLVTGEAQPGDNPNSIILSETEKELINIFRNINDSDKNAILTLGRGLLSQYSDTMGKSSTVG